MDRGAPRPIGKSHSLQWTTFGSRKRQELNRSNLLRSECDKIRHVFGLQYLTTRRLSAGVASLNYAIVNMEPNYAKPHHVNGTRGSGVQDGK
jgi:hypothetical protein